MKLLLGRRNQLVIFSLFVICLTSNITIAQTEKPSPQPSPAATPQASATPSPPPPANPADVSSIDAIIRAVYEVHSGEQGKKRDWDRMRSLFVPGARLILPAQSRSPGGYGWSVSAVDEYIKRVFPLLEKDGFFEKEVGRRTEAWKNIAQAYSAYESRRKADDPKPFMRGINSFQLINDGQRWWIVTVMWQNEDEKNPLPEGILKKPN
jgi:hypothetical protein